MLKLTQKDVAKLQECSTAISGLFVELAVLKDKFESDAAAIITKINEEKEDARGIMEDAANDAENYYDEKSEKWQEGDRGQAYAEWKSDLERIRDEIDEDVEMPEIGDADEPNWVSELAECEFSEFNY